MKETAVTEKRAYLAGLPQKRMGAGCLFWDEDGRVLLLKPTYKPGWEIPGGVVEQDESPQACCRREVREETGLDRPIGRLLVVDYNHPTAVKTESLMFIFEGGRLSPAEIAAIQLPEQELCEFNFFAIEQLPPAMTDSLRRRVQAAWQQVNGRGGLYLEDQTTMS